MGGYIDHKLRESIARALRVQWLARGAQYPDSGDVLAKMLEQGTTQPPPGAMLKAFEVMQARGEIHIAPRRAIDPEAVKAHGKVAITWVHPALLK